MVEEKDQVGELTLKELLENTPETLDIPGVGSVKVKAPTILDRLESREDARGLEGFDRLSEDEKRIEEGRMLALRMLVDPKMKKEDYLKSNDLKMSIVLDTVSLWYAEKLNSLNKKRQPLIDRFLEQMKEG